MRRARGGFGLVELLVALAVFAVLAGVAGGVLVQALKMWRHNEATTELQGTLRRTSEVVAQDLRSLAFGTLADAPVETGPASVAFLLPDGPAWPVYPHDSGRNASFVRAANVQIGASVADADALNVAGREVVMKNGQGAAVVLPITNVARRGGATSRTWNLVHPACANTIDYTEGTTVLQGTTSVGYAVDADTGELSRFRAGGARDPMAFAVAGLTIRYLYAGPDGTVYERDAPHETADGAPRRTVTVGGETRHLDALRLTLVGRADGPFGPIERTLTTLAPLPEPGPQTAEAVTPCD